jgi:hypothetical protein
MYQTFAAAAVLSALIPCRCGAVVTAVYVPQSSTGCEPGIRPAIDLSSTVSGYDGCSRSPVAAQVESASETFVVISARAAAADLHSQAAISSNEMASKDPSAWSLGVGVNIILGTAP